MVGLNFCYLESYGHFCEHFREIPGEPCRHCNKCDLYKTDPEDQAIKKAAEKARQEYLSTHPELTLSPQHYRNIGPASMRHRIGKCIMLHFHHHHHSLQGTL